jgi:hypothetical protein
MMGRWVSVWTAALAIGGFAGCATSGPNLKTPMPERFALPATDDARFSEPISYPKDTLNQDSIIKGSVPKPTQTPPPLTQPNGGGRFGGGGGAGGAGGAGGPGF